MTVIFTHSKTVGEVTNKLTDVMVKDTAWLNQCCVKWLVCFFFSKGYSVDVKQNIFISAERLQVVSECKCLWVHLDFNLGFNDIVISDFMLSDHKPILFSMSLPSLSHSATEAITLSLPFSPQFGSNFNQYFMESCSHLLLDSPLSNWDADQHLCLLNSVWLDVLNVIAPLKPYVPKPKSKP